ncbi:hypothetical protein SLEP1_g38183 [Rubroshorea leprosula]|uniref:Leucine-rich repeat-containing N-terminal plant-type domain-containing protein n=1 Tax=Rubroshorea leprosula TaxID=152421 RepID=A0AAV5KX20_9ROSI|nr:hypothetical protein SLEP1_g38183 [Rubroshorea leprosula]
MDLLTVLFIGFLSLATLNAGFCYGGCIERERQALLELKQDLVDPAERLTSWVADDEDCCRWKGVVCNNVTNHILELNLLDVPDDQLEDYSGSKLGGNNVLKTGPDRPVEPIRPVPGIKNGSA